MPATAKYNFVPLSARILPSPIENDHPMGDEARQNAYTTYVKNNGKLSGYIDMEITTMTSCFVGWKERESNFFAPAGKPVIPGSTIRGMIKNLFKIVTSSAMRNTKDDADFTDKKLYYRAVGAAGALANDYKNELVDRVVHEGNDRYSKTKALGGYLARKRDGSYWMFPVEFDAVRNRPRVQSVNRSNKNGLVEINKPSKGQMISHSGAMFSKARYYVFDRIDATNCFHVDSEIIKNYAEDVTRAEAINLLKSSTSYNQTRFEFGISGTEAADFIGDDEFDYITPCFYLPERTNNPNTIKSMGHNPFYRIQYRKSIDDHIPAPMKEDIIDFTDAIFGRKELWGSRVFFEDAELVNDNPAMDREEYVKELLGPKPTSYQFYLKQQDRTRTPENWNSKAEISGYKMYWHQPNNTDWTVDRNGRNDTALDRLTQKIKPIRAGVSFKARLRFERLSSQELGALMMVFRLPLEDEECCFKIGKGKSMGLGSIRVNPKLYVYDDKAGYENPFSSTSTWNEAKVEADYWEYISVFEKHMNKHFTANERAAYDISQRELAVLLDWRKTTENGWLNRIAQMENGCDAFRRRHILPKASRV